MQSPRLIFMSIRDDETTLDSKKPSCRLYVAKSKDLRVWAVGDAELTQEAHVQ